MPATGIIERALVRFAADRKGGLMRIPELDRQAKRPRLLDIAAHRFRIRAVVEHLQGAVRFKLAVNTGSGT